MGESKSVGENVVMGESREGREGGDWGKMIVFSHLITLIPCLSVDII